MALAIAALAGHAPTAAQAASQTYECTGGQAPFTVPAGVTQLHVEAHGGQGQTRGGSLLGGYGGTVTATLPVTPGETVQVVPGCAGNQHHNFGWGVGGDHGLGHSADAEDGGFGGGGSAVVELDGTALVVAGGGGGDGGDGAGGGFAGQGGRGGNGGIDPQKGGQGCTSFGCGNGGSSGGGDGGCAACEGAGNHNGGAGTSSSAIDGGGGGGGGGYVGGGGGHGGSGFIAGDGGGGGGGGSSYVIATATDVSYGTATSGGDGMVMLSWSVGASDRPLPVALMPLEGKAASEARAINSWGRVAGFSSDGTPLATVWNRHGWPRALAPLEGDRASRAFAINDWGWVAGESSGASTSAVRWHRYGPPLRLAPPEGDRDSFARGINLRGEVAGYSARPDDADGNGTVLQAVRWSADGTPTVLPPLDGDHEAMALAINDRGLVVGHSFSAGDPVLDRAVVWNRRGEPMALASETDTEAAAVNRRGLIAGDSESGLEGATLWPLRGAPRSLDPLDADLEGQAFAVNRHGTAAGVSRSDGSSAVIWPQGGQPLALAPLAGHQESWAWGINDRDDVVGFSAGESGTTAVLWPAPRRRRHHR